MADLLSDFDKEKDLADQFDQEKDLSPEPKYKDAPTLGDRAIQAIDPVHMWHLATGSPEAHEDPRESVGRLRALEQGATFGLLGKAAGLQDPERGAQFKNDEEAHPGAAMVGSLAAPVPGLGEAKAVGLAGKVGLHAATGAGLQALSNATHDRPLTEGTLPAAVVGGTVGGAAEGLSSPGFKNWLNQKAGLRATKALGAMKSMLKGKLANEDAAATFGNRAMDLGLVPPLASTATMTQRANDLLEKSGGEMGQVLNQADQARPPPRVAQMQDLAEKPQPPIGFTPNESLSHKINAGFSPNVSQQTSQLMSQEPIKFREAFNYPQARDRIENEVLTPHRRIDPATPDVAKHLHPADKYPEGVTFSDAQRMKTNMGDSVPWNSDKANANLAKQAYGVLNDEITKQLKGKVSPEDLAKFLQAKKDNEVGQVAQQLLKNRTRTELGNNYFSPGAVASGEGMGLTGLATGQPVAEALPKALASALAYKKLITQHGAGLTANALRGVANMSPVQPKLTPAMLQALQALRNRSSNGGQ